jgi:hypothetical protein
VRSITAGRKAVILKPETAFLCAIQLTFATGALPNARNCLTAKKTKSAIAITQSADSAE